jgi:hypothetical protein
MIAVEKRGDIVALVVDGERTFLLDTPEAQQLVTDLYATLPPVTVDEAAAMFTSTFDIASSVSGATCARGCGQPVDEHEADLYDEVVGFARRRKRGANQVALRTVTGRVAHARCVLDVRKRGIGQGQQSIG